MNIEECNKLVENNINLVHHIISHKYPNYTFDEDIYQIGCIGLMKASRTYNEDYGTTFSTYACRCILNEINLEIRKSKAKIRIPKDMIISVYEYISEDDSLSIIDTLCDNSDDIAESELLADISANLNKLLERDRRCILLHIEGFSQKEICKILSISQPQVSRILKKFIEELKEGR